MTSSRDRFFEVDRGALSNWILERAKFLSDMNPGPLGDALTAGTAKLGKALDPAKLTNSNDVFTSMIIRFFAENTKGDIQAVFKQAWVGKSEETERPANARAYGPRAGYEGHLVVFNAELEYMLARVAELYAAYVLLCENNNRGDSDASIVAAKLIVYYLDVIGERTPIDLDYLDSLPDPLKQSFDSRAGDFFIWGSAFVIGHEIGHHVLKHMDGGANSSESENRHRSEFEADSLAVRVMFEATQKSAPEMTGNSLAILVAPLVALTTIALMGKDGRKESRTHPSVRARWENVKATAGSFCTAEELEAVGSIFGGVNNYLQRHLTKWTSDWWT